MTAPMTITFAQAKAANACDQSYRKMARHLGGITKYGADTPVPIETILDVCGIDDAVWALNVIHHAKTTQLWACDCAERVLPIFESARPGDLRPRDAIRASRRYARGEIGDAAWAAARAAAWAAAWAAARAAIRDAAEAAARSASWAAAEAAAGAASEAADSAAIWAAAEAAAGAAARDAARAAIWDAAWAAGWAAIWDAAEAAEREWQIVRLREYLRGER